MLHMALARGYLCYPHFPVLYGCSSLLTPFSHRFSLSFLPDVERIATLGYEPSDGELLLDAIDDRTNHLFFFFFWN
jgi:hypothetical protein